MASSEVRGSQRGVGRSGRQPLRNEREAKGRESWSLRDGQGEQESGKVSPCLGDSFILGDDPCFALIVLVLTHGHHYECRAVIPF